MLWSRVLGLLGALLIAIIMLGSVSQLGISLLEHGGVLLSLFIVAAFVLIVGRVGMRNREWLENTYW